MKGCFFGFYTLIKAETFPRHDKDNDRAEFLTSNEQPVTSNEKLGSRNIKPAAIFLRQRTG